MRHSTAVLLVALITLFGAGLRLYHLNTVSLRGDEAFTVLHWMREPLAHTFDKIVTVDPQGPFNYALYRAYALIVGSQEDVVRFLPALISLIGIPAMYGLGKRLFGRAGGILAAFLWAIQPFAIWHAQDARSYAIWSVTNPVALWLALHVLSRGRRVDWVLYVIAATLSLYVYYLEVFTIAAVNLYVLLTYWRRRDLLFRWIAAQIVIALLVAPWYLQERLLSGGGYKGTLTGFDLGRLFTTIIPTLFFGETIPSPLLIWAVYAFLIVLLLISWQFYRHKSLLHLLLFAVPLLGLAVVSLRLNVFVPRYVLSVSVGIVLMLVAVFQTRSRWSVIGRLLVWVLVLGQFLAVLFYYYDYAKSLDWRSLATYLQSRVRSDEFLVQAAADESFTLYCSDYQLSNDCDQKLPANPNQAESEIVSSLTMRSTSSTGIWYVANPIWDWRNKDIPLNWLQANMQLVREASIGGLPAREFKLWAVSSTEVETQPLATFTDNADLYGVQAWREPNDALLIWLYWRPLKQTDAPLKIFVHLLDSSGIVAQDDQYPQDGRLSTANWTADELFRDVYQMQIQGADIGSYTLEIGLYDPTTLQRALLADGSDSYTMPLEMPPP